jgi:hypothetical protein
MGRVADFRTELLKRAECAQGRWYRVDLHNHSPASYDYRYKGADMVEKTAEAILASELSVIMFTDHERLPDHTFLSQLQQRVKHTVVLPGVELNVFVDAFDSGRGNVEKELFYHLLVGFDPEGDQSPTYWLDELYRRCRREVRQSGSVELTGVAATPEEIASVLQEARALVIPAHLHDTRDLTRSRSVDVIYGDKTFLRDAATAFTALEVTNPRTAEFFDGRHSETNKLLKTCIRSSDSHQPDEIGRRCTWVQMQTPSYDELFAGLRLPFRTSLVEPVPPTAHIIGMHIKGQFLPDQWLVFSPHCNMLIGVKGSGKTSVLECLRFALGADVPESKATTVAQHLGAILGNGGSVEILVRRADGALLVIQRVVGDARFHMTFEDDRQETVSSPDVLGFPTYILGWHEIEQAATDRHIRRVYMDTIAGKAQVRALEEDAKVLSARIQERHSIACQRYMVLRDLTRQVERLQELRKGLQVLHDAKLVDLKDKLQDATEQREAVIRTLGRLRSLNESARSSVAQVLVGQERTVGRAGAVLAHSIAPVDAALASLFQSVDRAGESVFNEVGAAAEAIQKALPTVEDEYATFLQSYNDEVTKLPVEQRNLLDSYREILEQTKALGSLEAERTTTKDELVALLNELSAMCERLAKILDERTVLRKGAVERLNRSLAPYLVRLQIKEQEVSQEFQDMSNQYAQGSGHLSTLKQQHAARLASLSLRSAYTAFAGGLDLSLGEVLFDASIGYFIGAFENDDLQIFLRIGTDKEGEFRPIERLSAGQRCTAVFPILLEIGAGVLVVDQPEDNLDNRHIATIIAPALLAGKRKRQMMFTSHNANLVVLADAEIIQMFESDGTRGWLEAQGFFATTLSKIGPHVIDILDGGERALEMRAVKYGLGTRTK